MNTTAWRIGLARICAGSLLLITVAVGARDASAAPIGYPAEERPDLEQPLEQLPVAPPVMIDQATVTLASGDSITVTVFGRPELTATVYVSDSGTIDVPLAGSIPVSGLSPAEASERIATAYREGEYLVDPQVNVILAALRSQQISVLGEVIRPGRFPIDTRMTILDALAQAGGIGPQGDERAYILRRKNDGVERFEVDLRELLGAGSGQVVPLRAGDTVVIPKAPLFYIHGEVARPGSYALKTEMTLIEATSIAGGITQRGSARRIEIKRKTRDGTVRIDADIDDAVMPEDVIHVRERIF